MPSSSPCHQLPAPCHLLREAASLALHVYRPRLIDEPWCRISIDPHSDTLIWMCFDRRRQMLIVAARGTVPSNWKNWRTNFSFVGGEVHPGVEQAVKIHLAEVLDFAEKLPFTRALFVGHSLGGAIITHLFAGLESVYHLEEASCITFGALRSRSRKAAADYDAGLKNKTLRVVNNNDLVPRLLFVTRRAVGMPLYFDRNGKPHRHMVPVGRVWDSAMGYLASLFLTPGKPDSIEDHEMRTYARLVQQMNLRESA